MPWIFSSLFDQYLYKALCDYQKSISLFYLLVIILNSSYRFLLMYSFGFIIKDNFIIYLPIGFQLSLTIYLNHNKKTILFLFFLIRIIEINTTIEITIIQNNIYYIKIY
jgi:hypothetical protein